MHPGMCGGSGLGVTPGQAALEGYRTSSEMFWVTVLVMCLYHNCMCGTEAVRCPAKLCEPSIACLLLHFGASYWISSDSFIVSDTSGVPIFPFTFITPFTLSQAVCKLADCLTSCLTAGNCSVRFSVALCNAQQIHNGIFSL